jgi:hypothetical protein
LLLGPALAGIVFFGAGSSANAQSAAPPGISSSQSQQPAPRTINLRVVVTDEQNHSLPGATCSLINPADSKVIATAATNQEGVATFTAVPSGPYTLRVEKSGFEPFIQNDVVVKDGSATDLKVSMAVGSVAANVTVQSPGEEVTSVDAGASTASGNIARKSLQRLPLATARVDEALPLIPGVVRSSTGEISIKGATEQQSALLVNGLNAADPAS